MYVRMGLHKAAQAMLTVHYQVRIMAHLLKPETAEIHLTRPMKLQLTETLA